MLRKKKKKQKQTATAQPKYSKEVETKLLPKINKKEGSFGKTKEM